MQGVKRVTISLPDKTYGQLETIIDAGNWKNRSQAITQLIRDEYIHISSKEHACIMAGSITIFYDESQREILSKVANVERTNINEVISTHRVMLEDYHIMEILVVQGYVTKLEEIQNAFLNIKGVEAGKLVLTGTILPPIHTK